MTQLSALRAQTDYQQVAADWLFAARTGTATDSLRQAMANMPPQELTRTLTNDDARKTFWINVYNATTQTTL